MPSVLHETFIANVVEEIQVQLKSIEGASASFAKEVSSGGSASIKFVDEEYGKHDPDAQFQHSTAQYPGVVIEVSYSQKRKDLARLADDYILGSDSDIRVVIGLDIEYNANKEAALSVWRPNIETNEAGEKELVAKQTIIDQVCLTQNNPALHADKSRSSVTAVANLVFLAQEASNSVCETSLQRLWLSQTDGYGIRFSSLLIPCVLSLSTQSIKRLLLGRIWVLSRLRSPGLESDAGNLRRRKSSNIMMKKNSGRRRIE